MKKYRYYIVGLVGMIIIGGFFLKPFLKESISIRLETEGDLELPELVNQDLFLEEWESGVIEGVWGENDYTNILKNGSVYGIVEEFLTFEYSMETAQGAFVVAGKKEKDVFSGSIWFVSHTGEYKMLEQNVKLLDAKMEYQEFNERRYLFLNYQKEGNNCGRVFLCNNTELEEILMGIRGKKIINSNGNIVCMHLSKDSKGRLEINPDTGEKYYVMEGYTEKPYTLRWYKDGTIREVQARIVEQEELLSCSYGVELLNKVEEIFPQGIKQYIIRDNGEIDVNIAIKEKNNTYFYYMIFQIEKKEEGTTALFVDSGIGCYFLHMTGDDSWNVFLKDFVEEDCLLKQNWRELCYNPFIQRGELEQGFSWDNSNSVGKVFVPEGELWERLSGFIFDYSENWSLMPIWTERIVTGSEEERELYQQVRLIGKTNSFFLYGINDINNMIVQIQDGSYLWMDQNYTSLYRVQPQFFEADFDNDGETELVIQGQFGQHGTGIYIESLLIVDKDLEGKWKVYQLPTDWYIEEMEKYYQTVYKDGWISLLVNGELVGTPVKLQEESQENITYTYSGAEQIRYQIQENEIYLSSRLMLYREYVPIDFFGDEICIKISYLGKGEWKVEGLK